MLRIAVVDDDPIAAEQIKEELEKQIASHPMETEIVCYTDTDVFWMDFLRQKMDALFLDLEMPQVSGFALSQKIRDDLPEELCDVPIVYVTCHEEWMIDSFPYKVLSFVRKQYLEEEIAEAVTCVLKEIRKVKKELLVCAAEDKESRYIALSDISYVESSGRICYFSYGNKKETMKVRKPLKTYRNALTAYGFVLINSGQMVNFQYIQSMEEEKITMRDQTVLYISRRKKKEVHEKYRQYKERFLIC